MQLAYPANILTGDFKPSSRPFVRKPNSSSNQNRQRAIPGPPTYRFPPANCHAFLHCLPPRPQCVHAGRAARRHRGDRRARGVDSCRRSRPPAKRRGGRSAPATSGSSAWPPINFTMVSAAFRQGIWGRCRIARLPRIPIPRSGRRYCQTCSRRLSNNRSMHASRRTSIPRSRIHPGIATASQSRPPALESSCSCAPRPTPIGTMNASCRP